MGIIRFITMSEAVVYILCTAWRIDKGCSRMLEHAKPDSIQQPSSWLSNNVVQVRSSIKPRAVCSNMHEQACQQHCSKQHRVSKTVGSHLKRILANLPNEVVLQIRYPFLGPIGSDSSTIDTGIISHHFVHPTEQPFHAWATVLASNFSQDVIRRAELTSGVTRITTLSGVNVA